MPSTSSFVTGAVWLAAFLLIHPTWAIEWHKDAKKATSIAAKSGLPLAFVVLPMREAADAPAGAIPSLADPGVAQILERHFVNVVLKPTMTTKILLEDLGAPDAGVRTIIVATFKGKPVGVIKPESTIDAGVLADELARQHQKLTDTLLSETLAAQLKTAQSKPDPAIEALETIVHLLVLPADQLVAAIVAADDAGEHVRGKACATLAVLSTPAGVKALLQAADRYPAAAEALGRCAPPAADALIDLLPYTDGAASDRVIETIAGISGVQDDRSLGPWSQRSAEERDAAIARLKAGVAPRLADWQKEHRLHAMLLAAQRSDGTAPPPVGKTNPNPDDKPRDEE